VVVLQEGLRDAIQFDSEFALKGQMGNDVIIGYDGKPRCPWAGATDTALGRYHDEVWGKRTYDEPAMFEALTLGVFEVGLSWSIVFGKRDAFRRAFYGFDTAKVAAYSSIAAVKAFCCRLAEHSLPTTSAAVAWPPLTEAATRSKSSHMPVISSSLSRWVSRCPAKG
jgi:hypothetical protein